MAGSRVESLPLLYEKLKVYVHWHSRALHTIPTVSLLSLLTSSIAGQPMRDQVLYNPNAVYNVSPHACYMYSSIAMYNYMYSSSATK